MPVGSRSHEGKVDVGAVAPLAGASQERPAGPTPLSAPAFHGEPSRSTLVRLAATAAGGRDPRS